MRRIWTILTKIWPLLKCRIFFASCCILPTEPKEQMPNGLSGAQVLKANVSHVADENLWEKERKILTFLQNQLLNLEVENWVEIKSFGSFWSRLESWIRIFDEQVMGPDVSQRRKEMSEFAISCEAELLERVLEFCVRLKQKTQKKTNKSRTKKSVSENSNQEIKIWIK